jgi:predicted nucleic acid-binding protein
MNLDQIQKNDIVLIDANIVLYALGAKSDQCKRLIRRCVEREIYGVIPSHILAEVTHRLMMAEARENDWITGTNPARQLSEQPERVKLLLRYEQAVKNLLATGIRLETLEKEDFITMMRVQRESGLLTNDALLVACAERLRVQGIASADQQLSNVRGIILYSPDDIKE